MFKNKRKIMAIITIILVTTIFILYNVFFRVTDVQALSKYGSTGSEVTQIQTKLKRWGYYNGIMVLKIFREENFKCNSVVEIQVICIIII